MQSVSTGIRRYLDTLDPTAAKAVRAARNNQRFAAAVERIWDDNPLAGDFVLAHVNSLFFAKEETPCKGGSAEHRVLGVYLDDPAARAELNARRESLTLALLQDGFSFDEVRIIPSKLGMRERRAFPEVRERVERILSGEAPLPDSSKPVEESSEAEQLGSSRTAADEARLLETFKRAVCLAMGDIDHAQAFLSRIEGAALIERYAAKKRRQGKAIFALHLFTCSPAPMREVASTFGPSIMAHAKELGLNLTGIDVLESPPHLSGCQAFPAAGPPIPYRNDNQTKTQ